MYIYYLNNFININLKKNNSNIDNKERDISYKITHFTIGNNSPEQATTMSHPRLFIS